METRESAARRCPEVHWFNPSCEGQVAFDRPGFTPARLPRQMAADFASLPMFLCAAADVVLVRQKPSSSFLGQMRRLNFSLPEFVEYPPQGLAGLDLGDRPIRCLRPWGWSPESVDFMAPLRARLPSGESASTFWNEDIRRLYSKAWSAGVLRGFLDEHPAAWLCDQRAVGTACSSSEKVRAEVHRLRDEGVDAVVKAAFGSSGQDQIRLGGGWFRKEQTGWLRNILREQGCVVVEPLLDKVFDLSVHFDIAASGKAAVMGWTRFFTDRKGQYRGTLIHHRDTDLDTDVRKFLDGDGRGSPHLQKLCQTLVRYVAERMADTGYTGPVGIDALVYRAGDGLRLKPIVEINPRFTMGRVALHLGQRVDPGRTALWLVLRRRDICAAGFADVAAFARHMEDRYPPVVMPDGKQFREGVLFTTDPFQARAFVTVLLVGESLAACKKYFAGFSGKLCEWTENC